MTASDRRLVAARPDLADARLRGRLDATRFVEGVRHRIGEGSVALRARPSPDCGIDTEALFGEIVTVFEEEEGWAWAQLETDGYVGYLPAHVLREEGPPPTHGVAVPRTFLYPATTIKAPPLAALSLGSRLHVVREEGAFAVTPQGAVHAAHLVPLAQRAHDFVAVAETLLGAPYLWGGRSSLGLDCSALLQLALAAAGIPAPRDSDLLQAEVGTALPRDQRAGLRRGDLVFWKGHCGMMRDGATLLHANGHHMLVASEPLAEAEARIAAKTFGPVTAIRRP